MAYVDCPELSSVFGCDVVVHAAQVRVVGAGARWISAWMTLVTCQVGAFMEGTEVGPKFGVWKWIFVLICCMKSLFIYIYNIY